MSGAPNNTRRGLQIRPWLPAVEAALLALTAAFVEFRSESFGADASTARGNTVADIAGALRDLPSTAQPLTFDRSDDVVFPPGGHLQGVQLRFDASPPRHVMFLSHDSDSVAYLAVVEFASDLRDGGKLTRVQTLPGDGQSPPLRHAGGMQLCGDILAIGLEDNQQKTRSQVQFWDVSRPGGPHQLAHLTVDRSGPAKHKTAGAVGLVARRGDHVLAVANWDSRAIDFYVSNGRPLADERCRLDLAARWQDATAAKADWQPDATFSAYQAINLVSNADGTLFLAGFATAGTSADVIDLFALHLENPPSTALQKVARKKMDLGGERHFRYAAGLSINCGQLMVLASEHDFAQPTRLGMVRIPSAP